jgi:glycosyltransferase involved in cell wall biosynthesis
MTIRTGILEELPPSKGKKGWPWTIPQGIPSTHRQAETVTVVTPSYNQGRFLEETIRSVLLQDYPSVEYMIFDGGSSDGSIEIIKAYAKWLSYWESAPDKGQADAISRGWRRASGSILAYLNSDDLYMPGAVARAAEAFRQYPSAVAVCGGEILINEDGFLLLERSVNSTSLKDLLNLHFLPQPSVFISRSALERVGYPDITLKNSFDFDLWIRLSQVGRIECINDVLAATRVHPAAKTMTHRREISKEIKKIIKGFLQSPAGMALPGKDRREIKANLCFLALGIALDNPISGIFKVLSNSIAAFAFRPAMATKIMRHIVFRMREKGRNNPWGLSVSDMHVSNWNR